jgi:ABC-2 type transport system ATP-binding protein
MITTQQLSRRYGLRIGIESVDLHVAAGSIFGFLGPNGAGKTTTIRVLLGFLRPTSGTAHVSGLDCWRKSPRIKSEVGYLPGDLRLYPWLTARRALALVGRIRGQNLEKEGRDLCDRFALPMTVAARSMSRGMRQKLGLILALVGHPRLLILDEPTTGLDPPMRHELATYLRERAEAGATIFFSSHTLSEVDQLCQEVAIVRAGRVVVHESLAELRGRAHRSVTLRFRDEDSASRITVPDFLHILQRQPSLWHCQLDGPTPPLIAWAAQQPLADIVICTASMSLWEAWPIWPPR